MNTKSTFLLFLVVSGIATVWMVIYAYRRWKKDMNAPEETVRATVVDKRTSFLSPNYDSWRHRSDLFYITFRTENGDFIELQVSQADYLALLADAEIHLTYKGSRIVDFSPVEHAVTE